MGSDDLIHIIEDIDANLRLINEVTGITKNVLSMNPDALEHNLAEYMLKDNFGESMYDKIQRIYHDIISGGSITKDGCKTKGDNDGR
ncbi:MAG: hypothetical protein ACP5NW_04590 [Candidatus Woesearchaeota archaeon]